jgi:uncharacterized membrane protein YgdD (TMEM256/DUF423 family)
MFSVFILRTAAILGFFGVLLGALGSHKLRSLLLQNGTEHNWNTAAQYLWLHTLALLALARSNALTRWVAGFWLAGIFLFSGSLFLFALTRMGWLVWVTPFGGISLMIGWICLAFSAGKK